MEKYNYREAIIQDIKNWILKQDRNGQLNNLYPEDMPYDEIIEHVIEDVWGEDSVTGNGLDGYASEEECQKYVATNLSLYFEATNDFGDFPNNGTPWIYKNPAQHMDATIRCYLLSECVREACDQL